MILPEKSPYQHIQRLGDVYQVSFNGESMQFLCSDTLVLPIANATVEEFSHYLLGKLLEASSGEVLAEVQLCVASGQGQKACARWTAMDEAIA